jgi:hypothetical protein
MLAFYIVSCHESGSLRTPNIYSFTCNYIIYCMYVQYIYIRLGVADHALTYVAHVTTAA